MRKRQIGKSEERQIKKSAIFISDSNLLERERKMYFKLQKNERFGYEEADDEKQYCCRKVEKHP